MPSPTPADRQNSPPPSSHRRSYRSSHSRSRSRSRSPPPRRRNDDRPKVSSGGFRWKDKSKDPDRYDRPGEGRLERGYREQDRRDRYRDGDRDRNGYRDRDSRPNRDSDGYGYRDQDRDSRRGGYGDRDRHDDRPRRDKDDRRHADRSPTPVSDPKPTTTTTTNKPLKEKKEKRPKEPKIAPTAEPMIIVNVNDRLGTKTAIPCLASDTIGIRFPICPMSKKMNRLANGENRRFQENGGCAQRAATA